MVATMFILLTVIIIRFLNSFDLTVLDSKAWSIVATKYVFLTVSLVKFFHENLVNGYVLNFQTVVRFKTGEDDMLTWVIQADRACGAHGQTDLRLYLHMDRPTVSA